MLSHENIELVDSITTQEETTAISSLCHTILPTFTHSITHDTTASPHTVCYTLFNKSTDTICVDSIVEAICIFFKFHLCQNLILSSHNSSHTSGFLPFNRITKVKISLNETESITIDPDNILQTLHLPLVTIISPLICTLKTFLLSLLNKQPIIEGMPLRISCEVLLKNQIDTSQLKKVLLTNDPLTKAAVNLYNILKIYKEMFIIDITDPIRNFDLNVFYINTTYKTLVPQVALGIIKSFSSYPDNTHTSTNQHFLTTISNKCFSSEKAGVELYKVNYKILSQLPNITENAFQYQDHYNAKDHVMNYQLLCSDLTSITTCDQLYKYIYLSIILHTTDNIKLSLELSLKNELIKDKNNTYIPFYSYDIDAGTNITAIISEVYFQNSHSSRFKKFLEKKIAQPNNMAQDILQKYNINIRAQIINIPQELTLQTYIPEISTTCTTPTEQQTPTTNIETKISLTEEYCTTDSNSLKNESSKKQITDTTLTDSTTKTLKPSYDIQRSKSDQKHIHNMISKKQKGNTPITCIVILAILSIPVYYALSDKFLNHIPDITKINLVVIGGIFSLAVISILGSILYNRIDTIHLSTNTEENTIDILGSNPNLHIH